MANALVFLNLKMSPIQRGHLKALGVQIVKLSLLSKGAGMMSLKVLLK
ncbi:hypothetical protein [Shewanella sp. KJ2020]|nr:hypothetical protein [Shewanella sp. KJ2020]MCP3126964.1 hypothetical protein [Shewanella sp. KJ2020]